MEILAESAQWVFAASTVADGNLTPPHALIAAPDGMIAHAYMMRMREVFRGILPQDMRIVCCRQRHGVDIVRVEGAEVSAWNNTDGLMTLERGVALVTYGSDCPSVCVVDHRARAIGICHSGRVGTVNEIASHLAACVADEATCELHELDVVIGPGICGSHYEVRDEDVAEIRERYSSSCVVTRPGHVRLDISQTIRTSLMNVGVSSERILNRGGCTFEQPMRWYSFRRDRAADQKFPLNQQVFVAFLK